MLSSKASAAAISSGAKSRESCGPLAPFGRQRTRRPPLERPGEYRFEFACRFYMSAPGNMAIRLARTGVAEILGVSASATVAYAWTAIAPVSIAFAASAGWHYQLEYASSASDRFVAPMNRWLRLTPLRVS
jgi:hypothetical protein